MRLEFQIDVLRFLCQVKDGKKYIQVLDEDLFDLAEYKAVFNLLRDYVSKYKSVPTHSGLLDYLDSELAKKREQANPKIVKLVEDTIKTGYSELKTNTAQIRDKLVTKYQLKLLKDTFREGSKGVSEAAKKEDAGIVKDVYKKIRQIDQLGHSDLEDEARHRGNFLLADVGVKDLQLAEGYPTGYKALNDMTSAGGFYPPQLVVFASEPKGYKTGTVLNIARHYMRDGYRVFYADAENGTRSISQRVYQSMLNCTQQELKSGGLDKVLKRLTKRYGALGGEFKPHFFPARKKTIDDIEAELDYLEEEFGWIPQIIVYDYLDLYKPIDHTVKEKRLQIQEVYFDAIRLQEKKNLLGITMSQVSKEAVNAKIIDMTKLAEDFGKNANCHAAFAVCSDEVEKMAKLRRIIPIVQREGAGIFDNVACFVKIDMQRQQMVEIEVEEWAAIYAEYEPKYKALVGKNKSNNKRKLSNKNFKDE